MPTAIPVDNRRSETRLIFDSPTPTHIEYAADGTKKSPPSFSSDISSSGMSFFCAERIPVGIPLNIQMKPFNQDHPVSLKGLVKWVVPAKSVNQFEESRYKIGVKFDESARTDGASGLNAILGYSAENTNLIIGRRSSDRRQPNLNFNRRKENRREKEFLFEHTVYLSDTNLVGNTYFAKHFEWQGKIREAFLYHIIDSFDDLVRSGVKLITKEAHCEYASESTVFDTVLMSLKIGKVTHVRLEVFFTFRNKKTNKIISKGRQVIVFGGPHGKPIGIPPAILKGIQPFR